MFEQPGLHIIKQGGWSNVWQVFGHLHVVSRQLPFVQVEIVFVTNSQALRFFLSLRGLITAVFVSIFTQCEDKKNCIDNFHIDSNAPCLPPKFGVTIVFDFSWDDCNTWEKLETMRLSIFFLGGGERGWVADKQDALWSYSHMWLEIFCCL